MTAPRWCTADPRALRSAVRACEAAADAASRAEGAVTRELGRTAVGGGWSGRAAAAADGRAIGTADGLRGLTLAFDDAAGALDAFVRTLDDLGPQIEVAQQRADALHRRMIEEALLGVAALVKDALGDGWTELRHQRTGALRQVEALVADCARADAACAEALAVAGRRMARVGGWTSSAIPPGAEPVLRALGLLALDDLGGTAAAAMALPSARLRGWLAELDPVVLAALLEAHPELARRLLHGQPPAGDQADPLRSALLYPAWFGARNDAPLAVRVAANRVLIAVALAGRRDQLRQLEAEQLKLRGDSSAYDDHVLDAALDGLRRRVRFYDDLLTEQVPDLGAGPGEPSTLVGHQVLLFDDAGDGAFAELWGRVGPQTANVGVLVPGTGTDMSNVGSFSRNRVLPFAARSRGTLAMITWMGGDLPDNVVTDAPDRGYAERLGPRLRDFAAGLPVPPGAHLTVAGHSYGGAVVGVAERDGLDADRVLHIESAGAGHGVRDVSDYPHPGTARYSMTAPGDPIAATQGVEVGRLGHGADPDLLEGVVRLETGRIDDTDPRSRLVHGWAAHGGVFDQRSTAWDNMYEVFTGGEVRTRVEPVTRVYAAYPAPVVVTEYPMEDPAFRPPVLDIP